jgi:hypothetical protein
LAELLEFDDLFDIDDDLFSGGVRLEFCKHSHLNTPVDYRFIYLTRSIE